MIPYFTIAKYAVVVGGAIALYHMLPIVGPGARIHALNEKNEAQKAALDIAASDIERKWKRIEQLQEQRDEASEYETGSRTRVESSCREQVRTAVAAVALRCPSGGVVRNGEEAPTLRDAWAAGRYKARVPGSSENKK